MLTCVLLYSLLFISTYSYRLFSNSKNNLCPKTQVGFFKGSLINESFYKPFLTQLSQKLPLSYEVSPVKFFPPLILKNNTVLIGHSFGGSICLWYYLFEKLLGLSNIQACILINSHFNQRMKMPYPPINMSSFPIPILVILTIDDEQLPISRSIDDMNYANENNITNIKFIVAEGNHTSRFTEPKQKNETINQIQDFLFSLK